MNLSEYFNNLLVERGVSIEVISATSRVPKSFLYNLKNGNFDQFPSKVYVRGYLKSLNVFFNLQDGNLVALYDELGDTEANNTEFKYEPILNLDKSKSKHLILFLIGSVFIICLVGFFLLMKNGYYADISFFLNSNLSNIFKPHTALLDNDSHNIKQNSSVEHKDTVVVQPDATSNKSPDNTSNKEQKKINIPNQEITNRGSESNAAGTPLSKLSHDSRDKTLNNTSSPPNTDNKSESAIEKITFNNVSDNITSKDLLADNSPPAPKRHSFTIVCTDKSWIRVNIDNRTTRSLTLSAGDRFDNYVDKYFFIHMGNAGGIKIFLDNKEYQFSGKSGEVKKIFVKLSDISFLKKGE